MLNPDPYWYKVVGVPQDSLGRPKLANDGDSGWLTLDVGFRLKTDIPFRMIGINAAELGTSSAQDARQFLRGAINLGVQRRTLWVKTSKPDKYGRWLVAMTLDGIDVNAQMVTLGLAVPYMVEGA